MENQNQAVNESVNLNTPAQQQAPANQEPKINTSKLEYGDEVQKMISTAGTLELTDTQNKALYAPFTDQDVMIKPDGLIYLPWIKYAGRLTQAFGGTGWAMVPQGMPKMQGELIIWGFHLVVKGIYCGFAFGEQFFSANNNRMTFGEACEGAKSNALMRLCKGLGIGLELWDKNFIDRWVNTYSQKKWDEEKRKYIFSLKPNAFGGGATPQQQVTPPQNNAPVQNTQAPAQNTQTPAPVKEETKATPKEEKKSGAKTKGKIEENTDFLNQKGDAVPVVEITNEELDGTKNTPPVDVVAYLTKLLTDSKSNVQLQENYAKVKEKLANGEITEEQKEGLRKLANQLFVSLSKPK